MLTVIPCNLQSDAKHERLHSLLVDFQIESAILQLIIAMNPRPAESFAVDNFASLELNLAGGDLVRARFVVLEVVDLALCSCFPGFARYPVSALSGCLRKKCRVSAAPNQVSVCLDKSLQSWKQ